MTETASSESATAASNRWLYRVLAATGIAVGIVVIGAVLYLLYAGQSGCCHSPMKAEALSAHSEDCCGAMKDMKMPMDKMPNTPAMPSMPSPTPGH